MLPGVPVPVALVLFVSLNPEGRIAMQKSEVERGMASRERIWLNKCRILLDIDININRVLTRRAVRDVPPIRVQIHI